MLHRPPKSKDLPCKEPTENLKPCCICTANHTLAEGSIGTSETWQQEVKGLDYHGCISCPQQSIIHRHSCLKSITNNTLSCMRSLGAARPAGILATALTSPHLLTRPVIYVAHLMVRYHSAHLIGSIALAGSCHTSDKGSELCSCPRLQPARLPLLLPARLEGIHKSNGLLRQDIGSECLDGGRQKLGHGLCLSRDH